MKNKVSRSLLSLKKFFKRGKTGTNQSTNLEEIVRKDAEEVSQTIDIISGLSDDDTTLIKTVNLNIIAFGVYYKGVGFKDGKIGTRDYNILNTVEARATMITDQVNAKFSGKLAATKYSILEKEKERDHVKEKYDNAQTELKNIIRDQSEDDKQYNIFQALIFVIFGVLMIASDVVVSLNLVIYFGIGNEHGVPGTSDGLLSKLLDMELLFFALGIAFCTIYVKILYDDYINTKLGFIQRERSKVLREDDSISRKQLIIEHYGKLLVKLFILAILIWFLFYLAKYRAFFSLQNNDSVENIANLAGNNLNSVIEKCFLGISIIIPIISGISLSVGLRIFGRRKMMRKIIRYNRKLTVFSKSIHDEIFNLKSKEKELSSFYIQWEDRNLKISNIATLFANNYNQGFREGYRNNFGNDLYLLVEAYRNEMINISLTPKK